jgi:hypothetical protein
MYLQRFAVNYGAGMFSFSRLDCRPRPIMPLTTHAVIQGIARTDPHP